MAKAKDSDSFEKLPKNAQRAAFAHMPPRKSGGKVTAKGTGKAGAKPAPKPSTKPPAKGATKAASEGSSKAAPKTNQFGFPTRTAAEEAEYDARHKAWSASIRPKQAELDAMAAERVRRDAAHKASEHRRRQERLNPRFKWGI